MRFQVLEIAEKLLVIRIRFFTGNSILCTDLGHSFAADDAEPSHHFAQESPKPRNLINLVANAYTTFLPEPHFKNF